MKTLKTIMAAGAFLTIVAVHGANAGFHDLAEYGKWTVLAGYGRAWQPYVAENYNWHPYKSGGYWVESRAGRIWRSSYPWADVTYRSGRWIDAGRRGWIWVPERDYSDCRVDPRDYFRWYDRTPEPTHRTYSGYHGYRTRGYEPERNWRAPVAPQRPTPPVRVEIQGRGVISPIPAPNVSRAVERPNGQPVPQVEARGRALPAPAPMIPEQRPQQRSVPNVSRFENKNREVGHRDRDFNPNLR